MFQASCTKWTISKKRLTQGSHYVNKPMASRVNKPISTRYFWNRTKPFPKPNITDHSCKKNIINCDKNSNLQSQYENNFPTIEESLQRKKFFNQVLHQNTAQYSTAQRTSQCTALQRNIQVRGLRDAASADEVYDTRRQQPPTSYAVTRCVATLTPHSTTTPLYTADRTTAAEDPSLHPLMDNINPVRTHSSSPLTLVNTVGETEEAVILTSTEASTLKRNIENEVFRQTTKHFNLRNLIKCDKRQSKCTLSDIYDLLFNVKDVKKFPTLTLDLNVKNNDTVYSATLDTGCNFCLIKSSIVKYLPLDTNNLPIIIAANDQPVKVIGKLSLPIIIGGNEYQTEFYVIEDLAIDIILGNWFLFQNCMELDFKKRQIRITNKGKVHSFSMDESWLLNLKPLSLNTTSETASPVEIKADREIVIAPHQHYNLMEILPEYHEYELDVDLNLREKKKLHVYISSDENKQNKHIHIYNASKFPKWLKQDALIGYLKPNFDIPININKAAVHVNKLDPSKTVVLDKNGNPLDINPKLTVKQHNNLAKILSKFGHMFTNRTEDLGPAKVKPVSLKIKPDAKPVYHPPYRQSLKERQILQDEIQKLIKAGILEESPAYTEFASPMFVITNSDNSTRVISDLRSVNKCLEQQNFPIVSVDLVLSCLSDMEFFTHLDLKNAFFQLEIAPEDRKYLTVITQTGKYQFRRMPQGLSIATVAFQRAITKILSKHLYSRCIPFIDDITVLGKTFDEQLENIEIILHELDRVNLKLNSKKCQFMYDKINILGHEVSAKGCLPLKSNIESITKFKTPTTIKQVRSFLGAANYFRRFVKNFAKIAMPLTNLIKEFNSTKKFQWTSDCEKSFQELKTILTSPPLLSHFVEDRETRVYTDASNFAIGAIMTQFDPETNTEHPIQYLSRKLKPNEINYSVSEKEFLCLVYALVKWREFLFGRKVKVFTDHAALQYYKSFKGASSRLTRLSNLICDYDLEITHKAGKSLVLPDFLSRNPVNKTIEEDFTFNLSPVSALHLVDLKKLQAQDDDLKCVLLALENPDLVEEKYRKMAAHYKTENGILYRSHNDGEKHRYVLAIPRTLVNNILDEYHNSPLSGGHLNTFKTLGKIKERYHWIGMSTDVENFVKTCETCQKRKSSPKKKYGFLNPIPPTNKIFQRIQLDVIGPLNPSNKYKYILTVTDACSRFAFAFPLVTADGKSIVKCLLKLICTYGTPSIIQSDRGTEFNNNLIRDLTTAIGTCHILSSAFTPQVNGLVENFNNTLINMISHYVSDKPNTWSQYIDYVLFAYNNSVHHTTKYKPAYLFFGFEPNFPSDTLFVNPNIDKDLLENLKVVNEIRDTIPAIIAKEQVKQKMYYDKNRRDINLNPGDQVLIWYPKNLRDNQTKFSFRYKGPYTVLNKVTPVSYLVEILKNGKLVKEVIHVSRMKLYQSRVIK